MTPSSCTMQRSRTGPSLAVLAVLLASALPATAAILEGQVIDSLSRAPLLDATVTILELEDLELDDTDLKLDAKARFSVTLPEGRWTLSFEAPHHDRRVQVIEVSDGSLRPLRVALKPMVTETVVVQAMPSLRAGTSQLTDRDLQRENDPDLVETLRTLPGVAAVRRGVVGLDPVVRGLRETQLGSFVDGTRMFGAGPGRMDSAMSHVDPLDLEKVEVLKGPHALVHGACAMSAVLAATKGGGDTAERRTGGDVLVGFDSQGSRSVLRGAVDGSSASHGWAASVTRREGRDYEDGDGNSIDGRFESISARVANTWDIGSQDQLDFRLSYQKQNDVEYEGRLLDATLFDTRSAVLEWNHTARSATGPDWEMTLYAHRIDHDMTNDNKPTALPDPDRMPPFPMDVNLNTESDTDGVRFLASWSGYGKNGNKPWMFQAGLDAYSLDRTADRQIARRDTGMVMFKDPVWPDVEIDDVGLLAIATFSPRDTLQWAAGARVDFVQADAGRPSDFFVDNVNDDVEQDDTNVSVTLSMDWQFAEDWGLRAGIGRVPRSADALERYADRFPSTRFQIAAEFMGNPALKPETASEIDLGLHWDRPKVSLLADAFYRVIDDYITIEADPSLMRRLPLSPATVYRYINGDDATYYGVELGMEIRPRDSWTIKASADWLWSEDGSFDEAALGTAPMSGVLSVMKGWSSVRAEARVRWADDQDRVAEARFERATAGWAVYDLLVDIDLPRGGRLGLRAENLTDHSYVDHLASANPFTKERVAEAGISFGATLSWSF